LARGAPTQNGRARLVAFEVDGEAIAADPQLIAGLKAHPHAGAERPPVVKDRSGRADVFNPVGVAGVRNSRVNAGDQAFRIGQRKGCVVRTADFPASVVEATDQRVAQGLVIER
jgi:hypothetical protein